MKLLFRYPVRLMLATLSLALLAGPATGNEDEVQRAVTRHIQPIVPADRAGGVAVALRLGGRTSFLNYGFAERVTARPLTADALFNLASLRKVLETTLLAQAVVKGELSLDDRVARYVVELEQGGDIRQVTLGQLATHTSGLLLPQDHPPWPDWGYTLPQFINTLNDWRGQPGSQHLYTHAGFVLLQLALERRFGMPIDVLIEQRLTGPLGMASTTLPRRDASPRGRLSPDHMRRAVQGYTPAGEPFGEPGHQDGYYDWPGTGQIYSSTRDMATFLAANLGELAIEPSLQEAMALAQTGVLAIGPRNQQALAWEVLFGEGPNIVEKYGGLYYASAYIGMIPSRKLGVVILANRGNLYPHETGRALLRELAGR